MKGILAQIRQVNVVGAGLEQRLHAQSLLDDVVVRREDRQGRFQTLEFLVYGISAGGLECRAGICRQHMLHESPMHIGEVVGRLAKGESSTPGAQYVTALAGRPERLFALLFHLTLLLFG